MISPDNEIRKIKGNPHEIIEVWNYYILVHVIKDPIEAPEPIMKDKEDFQFPPDKPPDYRHNEVNDPLNDPNWYHDDKTNNLCDPYFNCPIPLN